MKLYIDSGKMYQTFEGFGASGAWWAQEVGSWENTDEKSGIPVRDEISRLLFDKTYGIGLKTYRYNIGGGSKHSKKGYFSEPLRMTECFETAPGEYDWSRDAAAVYMMKSAVKNGADEVIFFVNSPIERLTQNGKTHLDKFPPFKENLKSKNYAAFAKYCLDVTEHFLNDGVPIKYVSPVNEPFWVWNGGQEGCHYRPKSCRKLFRVFVSEMDKRPDLKNVMLSGCENGDIRWFNKSYTRSVLSDPYIRTRLRGIDVHSYCLKMPIPFFNNRLAFLKRFAKYMKKKYPGVPVVMSEWTHMQGGRDSTMNSALVAASVIYEDLSIINAVSWQHWIAVSEVNYCDGLIYINLDSKTYEITKRYYVTGNFSKYIPEGAKRVEAHTVGGSLKTLAFIKDNECVSIVINESENRETLEIPKEYVGEKYIVTDESESLIEHTLNGAVVEIPPKSVTTLILKKRS